AYFYLDTFWKRAVLVVAGLFVMILKNGVRIVTLTLLASYVDPAFLYGRLHREGGVVFFLLGFLLLAPLVWLLQRAKPTVSTPPPGWVPPNSSLDPDNCNSNIRRSPFRVPCGSIPLPPNFCPGILPQLCSPARCL